MKVLFLLTHTPNCEPFWRSLEALGHEVHAEQYDNRPHDKHGELIELADKLLPDFIVYVGAYEPSHGRPVPTIEILKGLRNVAPLILLCGDAADHPWWPVLEKYHQEQCFDVIVGMDGGDSPIQSFPEGLTLLTPLDPRPFSPQPWESRDIRFGMVGGRGHRQGAIESLSNRGILHFSQGPIGRTYAEMAAIMCRTKVTLCCGLTGTGSHMHVKGRMIEAGFAGSVVLEMRSSPANKWFKPGIDYLEYDDVDHVISIMEHRSDDNFRCIADDFHTRVITEHHPKIFWHTVLTKAGI